MQADIQIFFQKGIDSPLQIKRVVNLDGLLQEFFDLEKFSDLKVLINVGEKALSIEVALGFLESARSQVILTESAFLAISEFFEIDLHLIRGPYGICYQTSTHGVVQKIYERLVSKKPITIKEEAEEAAKFGYTSGRFIVSGITKTWLKDYIFQNPQESDVLASRGIKDDISYQVYEEALSKIFREKLGKHRLNFLYGLADNKRIENLIPLLPPWVHKSVVFDHLILDVRSQNCFISEGILKFGDLLLYSDERLLQVPNLGKRSYALIRSRLIEGISSYLEITPAVHGEQSYIESSLNYLYINLIDSSPLTGTNSESEKSLMYTFNEAQGRVFENQVVEQTQRTFDTLIENLNFYISNDIKKPQSKTVFSQRLGVKSNPKSLQEIGDLIGVSRQRVLQIEKKLLTNFDYKYNISQELKNKIDNIRSGLSIPLTISGLPSYDSWFNGLNTTPWLLEAMFTAFGIKSIRVHNFENEYILAPGEYDLIPISIRAVKDFIRDRVGVGICRSEILEFTTNLVGVFTPELVDTVFYEATKNAIFDLSDSDPKFLAFGSKIVFALTALLTKSNKPLKCDEIQSLLKEDYEIDSELNYIRNICNTTFYLFAPSTFGLLKHLNFSSEEINLISNHCFDIMLDRGEKKQWHCDQLLDLFTETEDSFKHKIDKYKLRVCLLKSEKFIDLGRMVFIIKTEASAVGAIKRIEFSQFVEAILEKSTTPMHRDAIYKIIEQDRGLGDCSQIFPWGRLISIDAGTWGLMDKHLNLNDLDYRKIVSDLVSILKKKQFGLTESELLEEITEKSKAYRFKENPYILFSLGVKSKLCRREDIYLTLCEWEDCRRVTLREAITKSLEQVPPDGMKLKQILDIAEVYYRHSIDRPYANKILLDNNFTYDDQIQVWKRVLD